MNYQDNLLKLLRYMRISHGFTQKGFAEVVGCSRQRMSRLETGKAHLLFEEWVNFSKKFNISINNVKLGIIYCPQNSNDFETFKINKKLRKNPYSGGRVINLQSSHYKKIFGEKKFNEFCRSEKVDPLFLTNLNNSLNMDFNLRIIEEIIIHGYMKTLSDFKALSCYAHNLESHHYLIKDLKQKEGLEKVKNFLEHHIEKYETNHKFCLEEVKKDNGVIKAIKFSITPKEHINMKIYDGPYLKGYFKTFFNHYFATLAGDKVLTKSTISKGKSKGKNLILQSIKAF